MFEDPNLNPKDPAVLLEQVLRELDEIKRYSASTYAAVDNEMKEVHTMVRQVESKLSEIDRQIDKIEQFDGKLNELRSSLQKIERKVG